MKLSEKLTELRKEKGWSQEDFAEKLDVSRQAISRWENGTALPDAQNILRISKLFEVSADYLLNEDFEKCEKNTGNSEVQAESEADGSNEELSSEKTKSEEALAENTDSQTSKKKYPYVIFAVCTVILAVLTVWATVEAEMTKKELASQGQHIHAILNGVVENEVAPTCTAEGSYDEVFYCSVCDEEILRTKKSVGTVSHTLSSSVIENAVAPTCTQKGLYDEVVYCSVCNEELSRTRKASEKILHTPASSVKENEVVSTCTQNGTYHEVIYCKVCKAQMLRTEKIAELAAHWFEGKKCVICGEAQPSEGLVYMTNGDGTCTVDRGTCTDENVVIPSYSPSGEQVSQIKPYAFMGCSYLKSVKIPETVRLIGESAFDNCYNLESVNLPSKIKMIYPRTFKGCTSLKDITIPRGVSNIGYEAFAECYACESIVIPSSVTKIGMFAFRNFSGCDGTVTFEINNGWYLYDENEYLNKILNLTEGTFKPVMYLTFMYSDHTWKRN